MLVTPLAVQLLEPSIRDTVSKGDCRHLGGSMVGDLPPGPGQGPMTGPPNPTQWAPAFPPQPPRSRTWPAVALAAVAVLLGGAALVVALTRPTGGSSTASSTTSTTPSYTAEQTAAARQKLCDTYRLAARAVQIETNGKNSDRANLATVNGAVMLEEAVNANPAIAPGDRAAALALAESYSNVAATSSVATGSDDPAWQSALDNANNKNAAMKTVCGGS
ncbi:hypothetical protein [Mycobacterium avium]|uniref:hypothetical protein n=1 Tax=Mycobacterium avium TaxID=1764 RepID=UPI0037CA549E